MIIGQSLSQFYHLSFDAVETWQIRPSELTDYCEQTTSAETRPHVHDPVHITDISCWTNNALNKCVICVFSE